MKQVLIPILMGWACCCTALPASAQEYKEHVQKEFTLRKAPAASVLAIWNVFGPIKVEGYSGDKVMIEVEETLSAKNADDLEQGKKEFKLAFDQDDDTVMAYIAEPFDSRPHGWRNNDREKRPDFSFKLAFTVKVPFGMNLDIGTVNAGDVNVSDVAGSLKVHNVNGAISIANAKGKSDVHTVNGDITINYLVAPPEASSYQTINGNIRVTYPGNLSADLQFKTMNGGLYSDFKNIAILPAQVTKTQDEQGHGTVYRINKYKDIRIGEGGKSFHFETLNGNVYIKQQS